MQPRTDETITIRPPSSAESLRVVLTNGLQFWNVASVGVSERWITFRHEGTRYDVPTTSIAFVATHSAKQADDKRGVHDGRHTGCLVCNAAASQMAVELT